MTDHINDESNALLNTLAALIRNTSDLAFIKNAKLEYVGSSVPFANMVGLASPDDVRGRTDEQLFGAGALADGYVKDDMRLLRDGGSLEGYEEPLPSYDGQVHFSRTSKYAITGSDGDVIGVFGIGRDISKSAGDDDYDLSGLLTKFSLGQTSVSADGRHTRFTDRLDSLTGLLGYGYTFEKISRFLSIEGRLSTHALFLVGVDAMDDVNERFGYAYGDELIKKIAQALRELFRASDVLGRVGADRFLILMKNVSDEHTISKKAGEIAQALTFTLSDAHGVMTLGANVGVTLCGVMSNDAYALYNEASRALNQAKADAQTRYKLIDARAIIERAPLTAPSEPEDAVQLQSLLEHMDGGVLLIDVTDELHVAYVSPSFFKMSKRPPLPEGDVTKQLLDMVHDDDRDNVRNAIISSAKAGVTFDISHRVNNADGSVGWRRLRASHLDQANNGACRLICVISDITLLKYSEQRLLSAERRFRSAIEQTGALIWEVDIKTRTMYHQIDVTNRFGLKSSVFENMPDSLIATGVIHPDSVKEFRRMFANMFAGLDDEGYTVRARTANGEWVWLKLSFRLLECDVGESPSAVGTLEIRSNIESEMRALIEEERFANLIHTSLIGTITANLSTNRIVSVNLPIDEREFASIDEFVLLFPRLIYAEDIDTARNIMSARALLNAYREGRSFVSHECRRIMRNGNVRWTHIVVNMIRNAASGDIHVFVYLRDIEARRRWESMLPAPVERDNETFLYAPDTMRGIVETAVRELKPDTLCSISIIEIVGFENYERQKGVLAAQKVLSTLGRLFQAVHEGNVAAGYLGDAKFIVFRADTRGSEWQRLTIERFKERTESALSTLEADSGMRVRAGFAIERGGEASFASLTRKATIALTTVADWPNAPILEYSEPEMGAVSAQPIKHAPEPEAQRYQVLVADDDTLSRELLSRALAAEFDVIMAADGREALETLTHRACALVITDVQMPNMTGWELIEAMRADDRLCDIPVVVITADNQTDTEVKALDMGASDVIVKPFVAKTLKSRARNIIGKQESARIAEQNRIYELRFQQQANLLKRAQLDELTGLYNRQSFNRVVRERLDDNPNEAFMLVYLDIDNFKIVNDSFGSIAGDRLLRDIASQIFARVMDVGVVARIETDHFACFMPENEANARVLCDELNAFLAAYPMDVKLTMRAGIYFIEETNLEVGLMCDRAQLAAKSIKGNYTTHFALYDKSLRDKLIEERQLSTEMLSALENGQFLVYFQPQYDYSTGAIVGAEALARWQHPTKGMISPAIFIPLFERDGQISALDAYVWDKSCQYLRRWQDMAPDREVSISVNLSRIDLYNTRLCDNLRALIDKYALNPSQLKLEITESVYIDNPEYLISVVTRLQEMGFTIEMDDFGSGFSSLNTLKDVPVDVLKLDTKFLSKSSDDARGGNILSSVIRMARWLNLTVIAEGVETKEQADYLKNLNCLYMQGFFFARPMPAEDYEALLMSGAVCEAVSQINARLKGMAAFWDPSAQTALLFNSFVGGAAVLEYNAGNVEVLRTNDNYYRELGVTREAYAPLLTNMQNGFDSVMRERLLDMLMRAIQTGGESECELCLRAPDSDKLIWTHNRARLLADNGDSCLIYLSVENITQRKHMESKLAIVRYSDALVNLCDELIELDFNQNTVAIRASKSLDEPQPHWPVDIDKGIAYWCENYVLPDDVDILKRAVADLPNPDASGRTIEYLFYDKHGALNRMRTTFLDAGDNIWLICNMLLSVSGAPYKPSARAEHITSPSASLEIGELPAARPPRDASDSAKSVSESEQIMRVVADHSERVVMRYDIQNSEAVFVRGGAEAMGLPALSRNLPKSWLDDGIIIEDSAHEWTELFEDMKRSVSGGAKVRMRLKHGRERWCDIRFTIMSGADRAAQYSVISFLDVTDEHERALAYERYLQTIYTAHDDRAAYVDVDLTIGQLLASGGDSVFNCELNVERDNYENFINQLCQRLDESIKSEARAFLSKNSMLKRYGAGKRDLYVEWRVLGEVPKWLSLGVQMTCDLDSGHIKAFFLLREIDQERDRRLSENPRAEWDGMTGLYNRATCERLIRDTLKQNTGVPCALLIIDIDDLKALNDGLGHKSGDRAIQLIAAQLKRHFRKTDIIGRFGGDEFAALLIGADNEEKLRGTILTLINRVKMLSVGENEGVPLRLSVGASLGRTGEDSFESLYEKADMALYTVKRAGKGECAFYSRDMKTRAAQHTGDESRALDDAHALGFDGLRKLVEQMTSLYPFTLSVNLSRNLCARALGETSGKDQEYDQWVIRQLERVHPDDRERARDMFMCRRILMRYAQGEKRIDTCLRFRSLEGAYNDVRIQAAFASDGAGGDVCGIMFSSPYHANTPNP